MSTKICSKCKEIKDVSMFNINKINKDWLHYYCKPCRKTFSQIRYENKREYLNAQGREYYEANKDNLKEYQKSYYLENKDKMNKYQEEYRLNNKDYFKNYYLAHKSQFQQKYLYKKSNI